MWHFSLNGALINISSPLCYPTNCQLLIRPPSGSLATFGITYIALRGINMITKPTEKHPQTPVKHTGLVLTEDVKAIRSAAWLSPIDKLDVVTSKTFGRKIQISIQQIKDSGRPLGLKLRNKFSAVIIDNESYEELLSLKSKYADLVDRVKRNDVAKAGSGFDEMFAQISSPQTAARFKSLRLATTADLAASFKPGETESR